MCTGYDGIQVRCANQTLISMIEASCKSIASLSIMIQSILTSYENKHLYKLKVVNMINTQQLSKNLNGNKERKYASVLTVNQ